MMYGFVRSGQMVCPLSRVWRKRVGFLCIVALFPIGCSRQVQPPPAIMIEHEILPEPARVGPAIVSLKLTDATAKLVTGAHIALEADMTHAGMSPAFGEAREIEPGHYQSPLTFQMAGDWVILLHMTLSDGQKLESQFDVRGVRPN
jgi:YtkA-like